MKFFVLERSLDSGVKLYAVDDGFGKTGWASWEAAMSSGSIRIYGEADPAVLTPPSPLDSVSTIRPVQLGLIK